MEKVVDRGCQANELGPRLYKAFTRNPHIWGPKPHAQDHPRKKRQREKGKSNHTKKNEENNEKEQRQNPLDFKAPS